MKNTFYYLFLIYLILLSCETPKKNKTNETIKQKNIYNPISNTTIENTLDSLHLEGSVLFYHPNSVNFYSNNFKWTKKKHLPASTFKIPNTIIGLETGVISDTTVFKWNGEKRRFKSWEKDLTLKEAFQVSCVPCYQEVAGRIGEKRMNQYLKKINYPGMDVSEENLTNFWLVGNSKISQMEQIEFLSRLFEKKLPISEKTFDQLNAIMQVSNSDIASTIKAKTGLSHHNNIYNGWYVGSISDKNDIYYFATNIQANDSLDFKTFGKSRKDLTREAFHSIHKKD
ncbi:class D beta-lactamase [Aureivirga sp. CE67]|uniref:class D beta-lactamase n=1 Tax=Aureivirga sp. CE67 TaxID=1788983 RepID=UPI0018CA7F5A|nr:class D beta-lactamase [Aureivirga sp. CE67]